MTLLEINNSVQFVAQLLGRPIEMTIEQFNLWIRLAQEELFKEFASGYLAGSGAEVDSRTAAFLAPFKTNRTFGTYTLTSMFGVDGYRVDVNSDDYVYLSALIAIASPATSQAKPLDIISAGELGERLSNAITYPTSDNPVMVMSANAAGTSKYAFIIPRISPLPNVQVLALRKPSAPQLIETITNGVRTQSGSSTALEIDSIFHVDVIRKILGYLGQMVGNEFILAAIENQKQKEV